MDALCLSGSFPVQHRAQLQPRCGTAKVEHQQCCCETQGFLKSHFNLPWLLQQRV